MDEYADGTVQLINITKGSIFGDVFPLGTQD
jgi:hypothetical protein